MLWVRASDSLLSQKQPKLALDAARKALLLAPTLQDAQRALAAALKTNGQTGSKSRPASNLAPKSSKP